MAYWISVFIRTTLDGSIPCQHKYRNTQNWSEKTHLITTENVKSSLNCPFGVILVWGKEMREISISLYLYPDVGCADWKNGLDWWSSILQIELMWRVQFYWSHFHQFEAADGSRFLIRTGVYFDKEFGHRGLTVLIRL